MTWQKYENFKLSVVIRWRVLTPIYIGIQCYLLSIFHTLMLEYVITVCPIIIVTLTHIIQPFWSLSFFEFVLHLVTQFDHISTTSIQYFKMFTNWNHDVIEVYLLILMIDYIHFTCWRSSKWLNNPKDVKSKPC